MGQKKNYSRSFIILQENEKGHGISADKLPTGYAKIENRNGKCKVFFYVQNLKGTSKPYYMVLVCNKKDTKKLIKLGELKLDEYGKAEISREYSENDVGESGIGIDRVIGAAISQFNGNDMLVLMSGFNATDIPEDWRTYSLAGVKSKEVNSNAEKTIEVTKVETKKIEAKPVESRPVKVQKAEIKEKEVNTEVVKPNEVDRKIKNDVKDEEKQPDKKESVNIFDKYEESIENTKKDNYEESKNIEVNEIKDEKREENKCPCCSHEEQNNFESETHIEENSNRDYPIGRTGEFFKALTGELEDLGETFPDVRCCRWYKVSTDSIKHNYYREDHNKYTLLYYPMMPYYAYTQKSGCYLVGYKYDPKGKMKYLVYGILGTKNRCDQPFDGKTGFVSWVPMEKGKEGYEDKGCWLMFYDFKNAAILVPRR